MERKKIAVILSRFPYPLDKGDKLRAYHQIKYISRYHDVYLYCLNANNIDDANKKQIKEFCKAIHVYTLSKIEIIFQILLCFIRKRPVQVGYFFSKKIHHKISESIHLLRPDTVYCQLSRTALYGKDLPFKKIIDFQDAFSTNYERIQNNYTGIRKIFYRREGLYMRSFELQMLEWFDHCTIISEFDKQKISVNNNKITVISNGVDTLHFKGINQEKYIDILFAGNLSYLPNKNAVIYLAEKIAPLLIQKMHNIRIKIVGSSGEELNKYASPNIQISGWIEDIRDAYNSTKIFVVPLFTGAGLQNKLLEAMSMGIPCVTTSITNASLLATENEHVLIANDEHQFVSKIMLLLEDVNLQNRISLNARRFVESHFNWEDSNEKLLKLL